MPEAHIDLCADLSPLAVLSLGDFNTFLVGDRKEELGF